MKELRVFFKRKSASKQPQTVFDQPRWEKNHCPDPYGGRRGPCPQCCSREFAIHWCKFCTDGGGSFFYDEVKVKYFRKAATQASGKCRRCVMILACLEQCNTTGLSDESIVCIIPRHPLEEDGSTGTSYNKSLRIRFGGWSESWENIEIFTSPNTASPWPSIGEAPELPQGSSSEKSLEQTRNWLTECLKYHNQCGRPKSCQNHLPTRLIDVLSAQEGGPVRLFETSRGQEGRYLCLSHSWGDPERHARPLETKKESLKRHKEQIAWKSLPKTFQDAVSFVRLLGESYIWIDSLCIVQDCPDDWRQEASRMADIYTNSYLTLAATNSTNSTDGEPPPLLQRAWVYQERVLSPRMLHFGDQELLWECKEVTTCECGVWVDRNSAKTCPRVDVLPSNVRGSRRKLQTSNLWHKAVEDYTSLRLTRESDRLPAIAGIAKQLQQTQGSGDYLAGLWRDSLLEDLLWKRSSMLGNNVFGRRDTSVAPSWSWVCMKATGIEFQSVLKISDRVAHLVDANVQSDQHDVFTKASSGSVTIKGVLSRPCKPKKSRRLSCLKIEAVPGAPDFGHLSRTHHTFDPIYLHTTGYSFDMLQPIYYSDEGNGSGYWLYYDPGVRYLLTHIVDEEGKRNFLLALRFKKGQGAFERIGLLETGFSPDDFERYPMQTITIV
ncbi:heterokaryon incompatibility protein-domain-containing protein [Phyllosticta capitalensis]